MKNKDADGEEREEEDLSGGYEGVALAVMAAIARNEPVGTFTVRMLTAPYESPPLMGVASSVIEYSMGSIT